MFLDDKYKVKEEIDKNDRVIQKMKYGVIRIAGENYLREVTWETYNYLKNLPLDFNGVVEIEELNLTVKANSIVKIEEKESEAVKYKDFTKLPIESLFLDENFKIIKGIRSKIEREYDTYYSANCHYVEENGERQYYLQPEQIKDLLVMVREADPDYPHRVKQAFRYGRDVREIQKEQEKK